MNQVDMEEAAEKLFSISADAQVKRMRKWFWSHWPIHQTPPGIALPFATDGHAIKRSGNVAIQTN
ncbi:hypothetical protein [Laceyella sacchari]|uniref:Uncharacterized protein n=1 Tax=Laceyella sacchari TaxID=37482 RepID=A0ABY5U2E8_LACSH|nr:hypothetical protein [Laceyella sacchari]UWE03824.1 hypothetical protein NYR52_01015 [Laceyella sacchari]